jgi:hypothetical protein
VGSEEESEVKVVSWKCLVYKSSHVFLRPKIPWQASND